MVSCPIARHTCACTFNSHCKKNDVLHKRHIMKFFGNSNNYSFKACVESNLDYGTDY